MRDRFAYPDPMPAWLTDDDLDVYAGEFERTGFTGGLNRYRNVDRDWEDLSAFRGRPIEVPALFVGGDRTARRSGGCRSIERFGETLPRLHRSIILPGCGHWTQQERPAEVNEALLDFLASPVTLARRRWSSAWRSTRSRPTCSDGHDTPAPGHVFGGLLIGQALRAAQLTVPRRPAGPLAAPVVRRRRHGRRGDPLRGRAHPRRRQLRHPPRRRPPGARRRRRAHGRLPRTTSPASSTRRPATPGIPGPTACPSGATTTRTSSPATCPCSTDDRLPHARRAWFRPTAPVPDDPLLHLQVLAYLSDHGPTRAAREPHADLADDARRMSVSLDHSVWFHRPVDVNQWLLSELVPVATGRGRGLSLGTLRTVDGTLAGDRRPGGPPPRALMTPSCPSESARIGPASAKDRTASGGRSS